MAFKPTTKEGEKTVNIDDLAVSLVRGLVGMNLMRNGAVYSHVFDQVRIAGRSHQRFLTAEMAVDIVN